MNISIGSCSNVFWTLQIKSTEHLVHETITNASEPRYGILKKCFPLLGFKLAVLCKWKYYQTSIHIINIVTVYCCTDNIQIFLLAVVQTYFVCYKLSQPNISYMKLLQTQVNQDMESWKKCFPLLGFKLDIFCKYKYYQTNILVINVANLYYCIDYIGNKSIMFWTLQIKSTEHLTNKLLQVSVNQDTKWLI